MTRERQFRTSASIIFQKDPDPCHRVSVGHVVFPIKNRIRNAIEHRLATEPHQYGEPLRKTLRGYWKLRIGDYRIVFKIAGDEV